VNNEKINNFSEEFKMKNLILVFVCLLLYIPCQAAENQSEQERQNQLESQKKEFAEIEKYISRLHREIENDYKGRLIELNQRAQSEIRILEVPDKAVYYASLSAQAEVAKESLNIDIYGYPTLRYIEDGTERTLRLKDEHESYIVFADSLKKSPKRFAEAQSQIAERKSRILAQLEWEILNLERQKEYALTVGLVRLEKKLREDALKPEPEATHGVITGILYSADKPSAIVDRTIVHNGDSIYGVAVIKIYKDKVEFEKNGKKWEQKVQQKPEAYWK
jgi:hypothetical protein